MRYILLLLSITSFSVSADEYCDKYPAYCKIVNNHPNIDVDHAKKIAKHVHKVEDKYGISHKIYVAILAQESMYKLDAKNCGKKKVNGQVHKICHDFGMSQINKNTAKAFKFDLDKLTSDVGYSIEAGAQVLKDFKDRYGHKEKDWWTRYNSSKKSNRSKYKKLVERYMKHEVLVKGSQDSSY